MEIRFAREQDIPALLHLLEQVGAVHHQLRADIFRAGALKYDAAALKALLDLPDRPIFVAEIDGQVAGHAFCILRETKNDPVLRDRRVLHLDDLCVDEACRGRGIATALQARVTEYARELRCDAVTLNVWRGNEGAEKFYEKSGFHPLNTRMEAILEDEYAE